MGPFTLEIAAVNFAFAAGHRRIAINLLAGPLNSGRYSAHGQETGTDRSRRPGTSTKSPTKACGLAP
jgi:hypothetical protein